MHRGSLKGFGAAADRAEAVETSPNGSHPSSRRDATGRLDRREEEILRTRFYLSNWRLLTARLPVIYFIVFGIESAAFVRPARAGSEIAPAESGTSGEEIRENVTAGFGGYYRIGKCFPVTAQLENTGPDFEGEIAVRIEGNRFVQSVSLPSPSRKTFTLFVLPPRNLRELTVELTSGGNPIRLEHIDVRRLSDDEQLKVVSSTLRPMIPLFDAAGESISAEKQAVLDPGDLPGKWSDYEAVDSVWLDASDTGKLHASQRQALSRWVMLGGSASIISQDPRGAGESTRDYLASSAPSTVTETADSTTTPHGLGVFQITQGMFHSGLIKMDHPSGIDAISLSDLDHEILRSGSRSNPVLRNVPAQVLAAFFLLYGISIVAWLLLFKPAEAGKAWRLYAASAFPVLFALLAPGIGMVTNSGHLAIRQLSLIHVFADSIDSYAVHYLNVLSPERASFVLTPENPSAYLAQEQEEGDSRELVYEFGQNNVASARVDMNLWEKKAISLESFSEEGLYLALQSRGAVVLANRSEAALQGCSMIHDGIVTPIGDLSAGKEFRLVEGSAPSVEEIETGSSFVSPLLSRAISAYQAETFVGTMPDCVICGTRDIAPSLASAGHQTRYDGSSAVVFHLKHRKSDETGSNLK